MTDKPDYGIEFVNIEIRFQVELLADEGELPTIGDLLAWMDKSTSKQFFKFGFSYSERSHSHTVSVTDRGQAPSIKPPCLTQHGKSLESALVKCYFLINVLGEGDLDKERITRALDDREEYLQKKLLEVLGK